MTAKEKAIELVKKMYVNIGLNSKSSTIQCRHEAKQCALIAVDEIIQTHINRSGFITNYWNEVKTEIEKL